MTPKPRSLLAGAPSWLLRLAVFVGGFDVMVLEMCGFRVMTTEYGSSVYTTGSLLTLIMVALSGGYWVGGRLSRSSRSTRPLAVMWVAAAAYTFLTNVLFASTILEWGFSLRGRLSGSPLLAHVAPPACAVALLYGAPMLLLASTTPFVLQAYAHRRRDDEVSLDVGESSGGAMALSTVGSIAGTLVTSYVLIPGAGLRRTLLVFCASLCVVGGLLLLRDRGAATKARSAAAALAVWALAALAVALPEAPRTADGLVHAEETAYGRVEVYRHVDDDGEPYLVYKPSRDYEHSVVFPSHPLKDQLGLSYFTPAIAAGAKRVLVLGSAAGGSILQFLTLVPDARVDGVELDPAVVELSVRAFGVPRSQNVRLMALDARVFLRESRERYDYIIVDLFAGDQLPPHCVTREFFSLVLEHLAPGGAAFVNSNMQDYPWLDDADVHVARPLPHLLAAIRAAGFAATFQNDLFGQGHLYLFPHAESLESLRTRLVGVARDARWPDELRAEAAADALKTVVAMAPAETLAPFTDDWAPEELLQLKGNVFALTAALRGRAPVDEGADLRALVGAELVRSLAETGGFGVEPERYCAALSTWAQRTDRALLDPLARYHPPDVACEAPEIEGDGAQARLAADYATALAWTTQNRGRVALPRLLDVLRRVGLDATPML